MFNASRTEQNTASVAYSFDSPNHGASPALVQEPCPPRNPSLHQSLRQLCRLGCRYPES